MDTSHNHHTCSRIFFEYSFKVICPLIKKTKIEFIFFPYNIHLNHSVAVEIMQKDRDNKNQTAYNHFSPVIMFFPNNVMTVAIPLVLKAYNQFVRILAFEFPNAKTSWAMVLYSSNNICFSNVENSMYFLSDISSLPVLYTRERYIQLQLTPNLRQNLRHII